MELVRYYELFRKKLVTECHQLVYNFRYYFCIIRHIFVKVWCQTSKMRTIIFKKLRAVACNKTYLKELVEEGQYSTTKKLTKELDVTVMSLNRAKHCIDLTYKFNCWVPHELSQEDKDSYVLACTNLLEY